jgi:hypothetical protein
MRLFEPRRLVWIVGVALGAQRALQHTRDFLVEDAEILDVCQIVLLAQLQREVGQVQACTADDGLTVMLPHPNNPTSLGALGCARGASPAPMMVMRTLGASVGAA